ncbi:MAG TPA: response regulator [Roseomonas sp.]
MILIVDDQDTNRRVYTKLAAKVEGARVESLGHPEEALLWLEQHQPDLIITDFRMPGLDGAAFTRRVRGMANGADLPIVVVTVFQDRSFRLAALEAGATDFLLSPVDHVEFRTRVRNLLDLRRQQQLLRMHARVLERELAESEISRERLLRDSREALAQVIDTVPAFISAADREGRCVFANAHLAEAFGTVPAELVGRDMAELLGPAGPRSRKADRLVLEHGIAHRMGRHPGPVPALGRDRGTTDLEIPGTSGLRHPGLQRHASGATWRGCVLRLGSVRPRLRGRGAAWPPDALTSIFLIR